MFGYAEFRDSWFVLLEWVHFISQRRLDQWDDANLPTEKHSFPEWCWWMMMFQFYQNMSQATSLTSTSDLDLASFSSSSRTSTFQLTKRKRFVSSLKRFAMALSASFSKWSRNLFLIKMFSCGWNQKEVDNVDEDVERI